MSGDRKIGRNKARPAQKRYVAEGRAAKNKRLNIEKATKSAFEKKVMKVPRGTARSKRRANIQLAA